MNGSVAVVGSANLDIVVHTPSRPIGGQTVLGAGLVEVPGGKGLNQALAAARFAPTSFIGHVGDDPTGAALLAALIKAGIDVSHTAVAAGPSGRAYIVVTPDAENSIVVLPLANARLDADTVQEALDTLAPQVVLTQCEVPDSAVETAAHWCAAHDARFVLNLSPVRDVLESVLAACDPIIVNTEEGRSVLKSDDTDLELLATALASRARSAVITAGSRGAVVAADARTTWLNATPVRALDTTGAGDTFAGTLAAQLASGADIIDAARAASGEAARVIQTSRTDR